MINIKVKYKRSIVDITNRIIGYHLRLNYPFIRYGLKSGYDEVYSYDIIGQCVAVFPLRAVLKYKTTCYDIK